MDVTIETSPDGSPGSWVTIGTIAAGMTETVFPLSGGRARWYEPSRPAGTAARRVAPVFTVDPARCARRQADDRRPRLHQYYTEERSSPTRRWRASSALTCCASSRRASSSGPGTQRERAPMSLRPGHRRGPLGGLPGRMRAHHRPAAHRHAVRTARPADARDSAAASAGASAVTAPPMTTTRRADTPSLATQSGRPNEAGGAGGPTLSSLAADGARPRVSPRLRSPSGASSRGSWSSCLPTGSGTWTTSPGATHWPSWPRISSPASRREPGPRLPARRGAGSRLHGPAPQRRVAGRRNARGPARRAHLESVKPLVAEADPDLAGDLLIPPVHARAVVLNRSELEDTILLAMDDDPAALLIAELAERGWNVGHDGPMYRVSGAFTNPVNAAAHVATQLGQHLGPRARTRPGRQTAGPSSPGAAPTCCSPACPDTPGACTTSTGLSPPSQGSRGPRGSPPPAWLASLSLSVRACRPQPWNFSARPERTPPRSWLISRARTSKRESLESRDIATRRLRPGEKGTLRAWTKGRGGNASSRRSERAPGPSTTTSSRCARAYLLANA